MTNPSDSEFLEKLYGENPIKPPAPRGPVLGDELDAAPHQPPLKLSPNKPASGDPTVKMPRGKPGGETTRIRSTGETTRAPRADAPTRRIDPNRTMRMKNPSENIAREYGEQTFREQAPRTDLEKLERIGEEAIRNPRRSPFSGAGETQPMSRSISRALKSSWRRIGIAGLAGLAIGTITFAAFEWAVNRAQEKMGASVDLTALLPSNNRVEWISAPFARSTRDESNPYWEPNVFQEAVTVKSPYDGALAFGISLEGLPEELTNDINVNELGNGNSDWLCEPFDGYLICHSLGGYPLEKNSVTVVTMQFHIPGNELNSYLKTPNGSRKVYIVVP